MRIPASARALGWRTGKRAVDWSAKHLKLASYVPLYDYREQLDANTTLDARRSLDRDKRGSTVSSEDIDLTLTVEGLADVAAGRDWRGLRMLEVGPKYGIHTRFVDEQLEPSFLAFSDFEEDRHFHEEWETRPARTARLGLRRPPSRGGSRAARPVRARLLPRGAVPQRLPPGAAREAQSRHGARRRDAPRDDDRPATRLGASA